MKTSWAMDCSITMAWCFPDEATPATARLLERMESECVCVPSIWYVEVTNVLTLAERKGRIRPAQVAEFILLLESFDLDVDTELQHRAFAHLLPLCRGHRLTSYDAVYLDLAMRRQIPLATLDHDLRAAANKLGVTLAGK